MKTKWILILCTIQIASMISFPLFVRASSLNAGFMRFHVTDIQSDLSFRSLIWYPTKSKPEKILEAFQPQFLEFQKFNKAGHFSFIEPFPESIKKQVGLIAEDPSGFDRKEMHLQLQATILSFLNRNLSSQLR